MLHRGHQTLLQALVLSLAACSGSFEPTGGGGTEADAGPDQLARDDFELNVVPILEQRCNSCHETGGVAGSPAFTASYDAVLAYVPLAGGKLLGCTAETSLLYTKGLHVNDAAPAFDTTTEAPKVASFIALWAGAQAECEAGEEAKPATSKQLLQLTGATPITIDLAPLGPAGSLDGSTMSFKVSAGGGGLLVSELQMTAGPKGLKVKYPSFETCPGGSVRANSAQLDTQDPIEIAAGQIHTFGLVSLTGAIANDPYGIRFDLLTPLAGAEGPAVDNGSACAP